LSVLQIVSWLIGLVVVAIPIIGATCLLWLRERFPTKDGLQAAMAELGNKLAATEKALADKLADTEATLSSKIDEHDDRLDTGSRKMAEIDRRIALVEQECEAMPSRQNLQVELSQLSQRVRGVEVWTESTSKQLETLNSYLHTLIERGLESGK